MSTALEQGTDLPALAQSVLLPGFGGQVAPDWLRRRVSGSLGGVCLFARNIGDPDQVRALTDSLRAEREDVVISIDEEAGDVTRLDAATGSRFPGAAAIGRVDDPQLTEQIAGQVGQLLAAAGVTLNLAPCADVMVDPLNPVIGIRSFGSDPALVARHTAAWIRGQQTAGVAACAKHFPGHGDTNADTHRALAVLDSDLESVLSTALPPFSAAIQAGVASVMTGHLLVPAVDPWPATVSARWLTEILRGDMGFTGAVVTDALEMAAIAQTYGIAEGAVLAIRAGADLLCLGGEDAGAGLVDNVTDALVAAVRAGRLTEDRLRDAAARSRLLAGRPVGTGSSPAGQDALGERFPDDATTSAAVGVVARRALQIRGPIPDLGARPLILRMEARQNIAVGAVPWGPATVLDGPEIVLRSGDPLPVAEIEVASGVLLVTRDRHRREFMTETVRQVRGIRPDTVVLEMGTSGLEGVQPPAVATFGATRANTQAAIDVLFRIGQAGQ